MKIATEVERVQIDRIEVGLRRRKKLGNLRSLAKSIETHGLLHPILLRNGNELVAGQRRLEACRSLGWASIPARHVDGLSDEQLRAIELEENTERLALMDFEASKARLAEIRAAEAEERVSGDAPKTSRGGRPPKGDVARRAVAEKTGISERSQERIEKHVATAEAYPFMQRDGWKQYSVLEAAEQMEKLPERDRTKVAALLDQPAIPPKKAIEIIKNVANMEPAARKEVFALAQSDDEQERRVALTKAANLPAPPDPAVLKLMESERLLRDASRLAKPRHYATEIDDIASKVGELWPRMRKELSR